MGEPPSPLLTFGAPEQNEAADNVPKAWRSQPVWKLFHDTHFRHRFAHKLAHCLLSADERYAHFSEKVDYLVRHKWGSLWRRELFSRFKTAAEEYRDTGLVSSPSKDTVGPIGAHVLRRNLRDAVGMIGLSGDCFTTPRSAHEARYNHTYPSYIDSLRRAHRPEFNNNPRVDRAIAHLWRIVNWMWGGCITVRPYLPVAAYVQISCKFYGYFLPELSHVTAKNIAAAMWRTDVGEEKELSFDAFCNFISDICCSWCDNDTEREYLQFIRVISRLLLSTEVIEEYMRRLKSARSLARTRKQKRHKPVKEVSPCQEIINSIQAKLNQLSESTKFAEKKSETEEELGEHTHNSALLCSTEITTTERAKPERTPKPKPKRPARPPKPCTSKPPTGRNSPPRPVEQKKIAATIVELPMPVLNPAVPGASGASGCVSPITTAQKNRSPKEDASNWAKPVSWLAKNTAELRPAQVPSRSSAPLVGTLSVPLVIPSGDLLVFGSQLLQPSPVLQKTHDVPSPALEPPLSPNPVRAPAKRNAENPEEPEESFTLLEPSGCVDQKEVLEHIKNVLYAERASKMHQEQLLLLQEIQEQLEGEFVRHGVGSPVKAVQSLQSQKRRNA
eukprot:TRINITY_DN8197_c0_g1_i2.p1 TRINITY_DN8197_c0_g1~~TRINITY_DN8197_c0_g1_i2.p1  ORF type:complete len:629 (+),score=69.18 TRINITY_DN8197_c0_g1_i2:43-1887(+)